MDKNGRTITSFEATPDVIKILRWVSEGGFKKGFVINTSVVEWAERQGYQPKKPSERKTA